MQARNGRGGGGRGSWSQRRHWDARNDNQHYEHSDVGSVSTNGRGKPEYTPFRDPSVRFGTRGLEKPVFGSKRDGRHHGDKPVHDKYAAAMCAIPESLAAVLDDALQAAIDHVNPPRGRFMVQWCLSTLEGMLNDWMTSIGVKTGEQGPLVVPFGSSGLGVAESFSDVDVLVGVAYGDGAEPVLSPAQFFPGFSAYLESRTASVDIRRISVVQGV